MALSLNQWQEILSHAMFKQLKAKYEQSQNNIANSASDLEPDTCDEYLGKKKVARFSSLCRIHIHSIRGRLADSDGISGKAIIDGCVKAGLFADDSPEYIQSITFTQEKGFPEKTIISIEEAQI